MGQLTQISLEDGTTIYIEAIENTSPESDVVIPKSPIEIDNPRRGGIFPDPQQQLPQTFQAIESTIRAYTTYTLRAFKNVAIAEVSDTTWKDMGFQLLRE
jgi:Trypsin-co-occurring domain 1